MSCVIYEEFKKMVRLNMKFLRGSVPSTFWNPEKLAHTPAQIKTMISLHKCGLLVGAPRSSINDECQIYFHLFKDKNTEAVVGRLLLSKGISVCVEDVLEDKVVLNYVASSRDSFAYESGSDNTQAWRDINSFMKRKTLFCSVRVHDETQSAADTLLNLIWDLAPNVVHERASDERRTSKPTDHKLQLLQGKEMPQVPLYIYECIIEFSSDMQAWGICNLVCKDWHKVADRFLPKVVFNRWYNISIQYGSGEVQYRLKLCSRNNLVSYDLIHTPPGKTYRSPWSGHRLSKVDIPDDHLNKLSRGESSSKQPTEESSFRMNREAGRTFFTCTLFEDNSWRYDRYGDDAKKQQKPPARCHVCKLECTSQGLVVLESVYIPQRWLADSDVVLWLDKTCQD